MKQRLSQLSNYLWSLEKGEVHINELFLNLPSNVDVKTLKLKLRVYYTLDPYSYYNYKHVG